MSELSWTMLGTAPRTEEGPPRTLSQEEAQTLSKKVIALATGGGETQVTIQYLYDIRWQWSRNRVVAASVTSNPTVTISRFRQGTGASAVVTGTRLDDLKKGVLSAEAGIPAWSAGSPSTDAPFLAPAATFTSTSVLDPAVDGLTAEALAHVARASVENIAAQSYQSAGTCGLRIATIAVSNSQGLSAYGVANCVAFTHTVRNPENGGIGWASRRQPSWSAMDIPALTRIAAEQCDSTSKPRAVEPGRYTTILSPIAVEALWDIVAKVMDRENADRGATVFAKDGKAQFGKQIMDPRITIDSDPSDADAGYLPFDADGFEHKPTTWIKDGILVKLPYGRRYAEVLNQRNLVPSTQPIPNPFAFRMTGGTASIEEMIASTERGVLITNFSRIDPFDAGDDFDLVVQGVTRHGMWLIEKGKIKFAVKPMRFMERPMQVFNRILAIGKSELSSGMAVGTLYGGAFSSAEVTIGSALPSLIPRWGRALMKLPSLKVSDFNFVGMADSI